MSDLELFRNRHELCRQLSQHFGRIGIQADKTLIVYGNDYSSGAEN
jgi:3-mercaptopyruvate sulfurtransferase SseA